jgi:hypothetical protein
MSDFDIEPDLSEIPDEPLSREKSDAYECRYGKFDLQASIAGREADAAESLAASQSAGIVPAESTPDDAPPL